MRLRSHSSLWKYPPRVWPHTLCVLYPGCCYTFVKQNVVTLQQVYCFSPPSHFKMFNTRWKIQKFICFPTPGLFTWRAILPLSWPVLYWGAQMIPRELPWKLSVIYRILQDYVECFPPQQTYWFLPLPLSTEGFERTISKSAMAKLLHLCEHSLVKRDETSASETRRKAKQPCVHRWHKKEELGLLIFLTSKWCISAFTYGRLHTA